MLPFEFPSSISLQTIILIQTLLSTSPHSAQCLHSCKLSRLVLIARQIHSHLTTVSETRWTCYEAPPIPDSQLKAIVDAAANHVMSALSMQAARVVLTGKSNEKLWEIVNVGYLATL